MSSAVWPGMSRKTSDFDDTPLRAKLLQNSYLRVRGEMRRRSGFARSQLASIGVPILGIMPAIPTLNPIVALLGSGTIEGFGVDSAFGPAWGDIQLEAPTGTAATGGGGDASPPFSDTYNENNPFNDSFYTTWPGDYAVNTGGPNANSYRVRVQISATYTYELDGVTWPDTVTGQVFFESSYGPVAVFSDVGADPVSWTELSPDQGTFYRFHPVNSAVPVNDTIDIDVSFDVQGGAGVSGMSIGVSSSLLPGTIGSSLVGTLDISVTQLTGLSDDWTLTINRQDDFARSFEVWGKIGGYPIEPGDGVRVGEYEIAAGESQVIETWTPPTVSAAWKFIAVARRGGRMGPIGRLT